MTTTTRIRVVKLGLLLLLIGNATTTQPIMARTADDYWPTWRGPRLNGTAPAADPPTTFSETENLKWKVELPDGGESSPIVWADKIFLQTAVPSTHEPVKRIAEKDRHQQPRSPTDTVQWRFGLLCLSRETGEVLWNRTARVEVPHARHHITSSHSAWSAVTDGSFIWACFGSRGLHCYDLDGVHQWSADLPKMEMYSEYGEGGSPAIAGDNIVVVQDQMVGPAIFAFNKITGQLSWKRERGTGASAWSTPLVVNVDGELQVITSGNKEMMCYDADTGETIWRCDVPQTGTIPSPVAGFGNVYYMCGHPGASLMAIKLGGQGDLTDSDAIVWQMDRHVPYVTSPLLYDDKIYFLKKYAGAISSVRARTGDPSFLVKRMRGMTRCYASPVGAAGRVYIADRQGQVTVIDHSDEFNVLATNQLDEGFDASPAIAGNEIYLRGERHLYCFSRKL